MRFPDFGRNNYQYDVAFRFDCLEQSLINKIVEALRPEMGSPVMINRGEAPYQVTLTRGAGNEAEPFREIRIGKGGITFWCGWHLRLEDWTQWRDGMVHKATDLLAEVPTHNVNGLQAQAFCGIPSDRLLPIAEVPELREITEFHARFMDGAKFSPVHATVTLLEESGAYAAEWGIGPNLNAPGSSLATVLVRCTQVDERVALRTSTEKHRAMVDQITLAFGSKVIRPLVRQ